MSKKTILIPLLILFLSAPLNAAPPQAAEPFTPPRVSSLGQASQVVGITGISVTYGRPSVNEREIWGELVPYGQVWRLGANDATHISFTTAVEIEGEKLAAGSYALFALPEKDAWTLIFNRTAEQWGNFSHDEKEDVLRVKVEPRTSAEHRELFTVDFPAVEDEETVMRLAWEKLEVPVTIRATASNHAKLQLARRAVAEHPDDVGHLWEWVAYLAQEEVTAPELPMWASRIVEAFPGYYPMSLQATVLAQNGQTDDALRIGEAALAEGRGQLGSNPFLTEAQLETFAGTLAEWRGEAD